MKKYLPGFVMILLISSFALFACSDDSTFDWPKETATDGDMVDGDQSEVENDAEPSYMAYTTLYETYKATKDIHGAECVDSLEPYCANPAYAFPEISVYSDHGFGEWTLEDGEPFQLDESLGVNRSDTGERRSLLTFAQFSDVHITDEEGLMRMAKMDSKVVPSALRPMDMYTELTLDAAVKAVNYFNSLSPMSFLLVTGDSTDTAQKNELENFLTVLSGGEVDPDSGDDDDPVTGEGNDPQDTFLADGLDIPFVMTQGNHDVLILGNFIITEDAQTASMGDNVATGTRDGETYEVVNGTVPADVERRLLMHDEYLATIKDWPGLPEGHGLTQANVDNDRGYYTYEPTADSPIRFLVMDSGFRPQGFENAEFNVYTPGVIDVDMYNNFLIPELDKALQDKKLVILATHHPSYSMVDDGLPERFIAADVFIDKMKSYPNVLAHLVGHGHNNKIITHKADGSDSGYFEIQCASLIDWPQQFRMYELVDNDNGTLSLFTVVTNHQGGEGHMANESRKLSLIDLQTNWGEGSAGSLDDRNVEMIFAVPSGFEDMIANTPSTEVQATTNW